MKIKTLKKKILILAMMTFATGPLFAQQQGTVAGITQILSSLIIPDTAKIEYEGDVITDTIPLQDGFYQPNNLDQAMPFAYPEVNTRNIRFYKRIWRDIDLKDDKNAILAIPGNSLMELMMRAIDEGKLSLYRPEDDAFKYRMGAAEGIARFTDSVLVPIFDEEGNQIDSKMTLNEFDPSKVSKFRIKEDIFFDKQRSSLESRIIGIAPLMTITTSAELAESVGTTPAFWIYFPQLRYTTVQVDISDPDNGVYDMTMDDFFVQHKYTSTIVRESSPSMLRKLKQDDNGSVAIDSKEIEDKLDAYKKKLWNNPTGIKTEELEETVRTEKRNK